jgi:hypothetical protein
MGEVTIRTQSNGSLARLSHMYGEHARTGQVVRGTGYAILRIPQVQLAGNERDSRGTAAADGGQPWAAVQNGHSKNGWSDTTDG